MCVNVYIFINVYHLKFLKITTISEPAMTLPIFYLEYSMFSWKSINQSFSLSLSLSLFLSLTLKFA